MSFKIDLRDTRPADFFILGSCSGYECREL